ncbi:hypothetical protein EJB05_00872, partial [Eragrostis curvula]
MAQESCDLNKDEAEILKPSSSSSPSPSPTTAAPPQPTTQIPEPPPQQSSPPTPPAAAPQFMPKPCGEVPIEASKKRKLADATATDAEALSMLAPAEPLSPVLFVNRCNICRKRVGLTGFRCRCGDLFCPRHRHSETHNCTFDYKTAGREEIARANPNLVLEMRTMSEGGTVGIDTYSTNIPMVAPAITSMSPLIGLVPPVYKEKSVKYHCLENEKDQTS